MTNILLYRQYTVNIEDLTKLDDEELMGKYKFCAFSDDFDFLKIALKERGDWMDEWDYSDSELSVYQDEYCIIAKIMKDNKVYDLTNTSSSELDKQIKMKISSCLFRDIKNKNINQDLEKKLISRIGNMSIIEYEGYYFAVENSYAEEFPNNQYLESQMTRYDVSISVIEEYCKELLTEVRNENSFVTHGFRFHKPWKELNTLIEKI